MRALALGRTYALAAFVLRRPRRGDCVATPLAAAATGGAGVPPPPPPGPHAAASARRLRRSPRRCRRRSSRATAAPRSRPPPRPQQVKNAIYAANRIIGKPYRYGGGHRRFNDSRLRLLGLRQLRAARRRAASSARCTRRAFMSWGEAGRGQWITVYTNPGHAYVVIAGLRFDTSGPGPARPALAQGRALEPRVHRAAPRRLLGRLAPDPWSRAARAWATRRRPRRRPSATRAARARCRRPTGVPVETMSPGLERHQPREVRRRARAPRRSGRSVSADCIVSPFSVSAISIASWAPASSGVTSAGPHGARAVEDLARHPLRRGELQVARREVVEQHVAGDVVERVALGHVAARRPITNATSAS